MDRETADLVKRFTGNTLTMSLRPAGALIGVTAPTITALRKWYAAGADPAKLTASQQTIDGVRAYMAVADQVEARRAALRIAAERLDEVARDLRAEADRPDAGATAPPSGAGAESGGRVRKSSDELRGASPTPPQENEA